MTFKKFEDIEAWQLARELCKIIKHMTEKPNFAHDWDLRKQIRASSGSAMDCIAEGFERGNNAEFLYFLGVTLGSSGEVRSQLYRALDYGSITETEMQEAFNVSSRVSAATRGLVNYLNQSEIQGIRKKKTNKKVLPKSEALQGDPNFPAQIPPYI